MTIDCLSAGILVADHLSPPIERLPDAGQLVLVDDLPLAIGGCAANTAIDLARLALRVGILGCVGRDPFGQFLVETLGQRGIDTKHIRRVEGRGTSGTLIINVRGQDRRFIHAIGANAALRAQDISPDLVTKARVFYVGGYLLMPGLEQNGLCELFRTARRAGVKTVLDVVLPGPGDHWTKLDKLLSETDVFLPNDDEAAAITGKTDPLEQAEQFRAAGAGTVVITCGQKGTYLTSAQRRLRAGVYDVPFVGGTGAGDAFDAGYIAGLLLGEDEEGCLRWGSALGASCVRGIGATETVFDRAGAQEFMATSALRIERL
jgi:sugar/nucleoside kinase (ribokinase family)